MSRFHTVENGFFIFCVDNLYPYMYNVHIPPMVYKLSALTTKEVFIYEKSHEKA